MVKRQFFQLFISIFEIYSTDPDIDKVGFRQFYYFHDL